jgi:hypothetical protein
MSSEKREKRIKSCQEQKQNSANKIFVSLKSIYGLTFNGAFGSNAGHSALRYLSYNPIQAMPQEL